MTDCIFCSILKKEIPSYKIYEDEYSYAFLDISKDCYGHTLIIPKNHHKNLFEISDDHLSKVMLATKKIASHFKSLGFSGVNIINNSGASAEQTVNHFHIHIIPRKEGDNLKIFPSLTPKNIDLEEVQKKLFLKS